MSAPVPISPTVLIVGNPGANHVGAHFLTAATSMGVPATLCDVGAASSGSVIRTKLQWWLGGHRPARLTAFSRHVLEQVTEHRPRYLLSTGLAPIDASALQRIGRLGVVRLNFLTDDPWNQVHRAPWFLDALRHYDHVLTPRHANVQDLERATSARIEYLPFAYSPDQHFPDPPATGGDERDVHADVLFAGGADEDRVAAIAPLLRAGVRVALYGGYWNRYAETRPYALGFLNPAALRRAVGAASVNLCLVRRANRDGHSMRSFEIPAMGGCMVAENTDDHRRMFGTSGDAVIFCDGPRDTINAVRRLLESPDERRQLAARACQVITQSRATYADRLTTILELAAA